MTDRQAGLVWCPFPDAADAARVANVLLDEGLIACANIMPAMQSLYVWNAERGESRECGVLFKTAARRLGAVIARIEALHPYDTPAITGWHCDAASGATLDWLAAVTGGNTP